MKEALLTALEPLLLQRAGTLARALPAERRERVRRLARAASVRENLAREAREPEAIPAALCLGREALALSTSALLASRGELEGDALSPAEAWSALERQGLAQRELEQLMTSTDPALADSLGLEAQQSLQAQLDQQLALLRSHYEPRSLRQLAVARGLRLVALLSLLCFAVLAFVAVTVRP